MDGIADAGGNRELFGPLLPIDRAEPAFREPWEGHAFATMLLANRAATASNIHAMRHALERVPREDYLASYYGRWELAAETLLTESRLLAEGEVDARLVDPPLRHHTGRTPSPGVMAQGAQRTVPGAQPGNLRTVEAPPLFALGDDVRTAAEPTTGHTRLPSYARGRRGTVTAVRPAQVTPDSAAHFVAEDPQHVYAVTFSSLELWGPGEEFTVTVDLFESYLS